MNAPLSGLALPPSAEQARCAWVERLSRAELLSPLDRHLGRAVAELDGADELVAAAAALASRAVQLGHVCLDLQQLDLLPLVPEEQRALGWPQLRP